MGIQYPSERTSQKRKQMHWREINERINVGKIVLTKKEIDIKLKIRIWDLKERKYEANDIIK